MAGTPWHVTGEYFETCSCDFLCPCITTNMAAQPTKGSCTAVLAFRIDQGRFDSLTLDGLTFVMFLRTPGVMSEGNWSVGVITDERASAEQQQALLGIASGQAGGPMAGLGGLVGTFLGAEARPIQFDKSADGLHWSLSVPGLIDQAAEGVPSLARQGDTLYVDNTLHPANARLALAKASRSHLHAFGLDWDDDSGRNNGHFAPFEWRSA